MAFLEDAALDDVEALARLDCSDSLLALARSGAQVRRAVVAAQESGIERVASGDRPRAVLLAALGGSSVVGEVLDLLTEPSSPVPVTTRRDGPLPGWVGPLDLVIAVSQSGYAVGPVALAAEAARRGASLLTVGAADSPLAEACARGRGVHVTPALPAPSSRTALWSLLTPVLMAAHQLGLASCDVATLDQVADVLDQVATDCRPSSESFVNPAKGLALRLGERVPVVLGDGELTGVAASRAAAMLARTARVPATHGWLPDAAAQVVACLEGPFGAVGGHPASGEGESSAQDDIFADPYLDAPPGPNLGLLLLRDPALEARQRDVAESVAERARTAGVTLHEEVAREGHPLVRLASLIGLTDFAATYLALGSGLDPTGTAAFSR